MVHRKSLALILLIFCITLLSAEDTGVNNLTDSEQDEFSVGQEMVEPDSILPEADVIYEADSEESVISVVNREEVIARIEDYRLESYPNSRYFDPILAPYSEISYRLSFDFAGLQNEPNELKSSGFTLPGSFLQSWTYQGYLAQFHQLKHDAWGMNAVSEIYDYPVSLSRLEGSLGDYDSRYVLASFSKGDLFGFTGSSMEFDYTIYNGNWVDASNSGNSIKQFLSYRFEDFLFSVDLASYNKEGGSYELNPAYWHLGNFRYEHKFSQIIGQINHPLLNLSVASLADELSFPAYNPKWKTNSLHLAAHSDVNLPGGKARLRYEYRDLNRDYIPARGYNFADFKEELSLDIEHNSLVGFNANTRIKDWDLWQTKLDLFKDLGIWRLGLDSDLTKGYSRLNIASSPIDGSMMPVADLYIPHVYGLYGLVNLGNLKLRASIRQKHEKQYNNLSEISENLYLLNLAGTYDARWKDWQVKVDAIWRYQEYNSAMMGAPEFSFSSEQRIFRHLDHDNRLELGFALNGHSDYYLPNAVNPYLIEASTILDAWAAVRISKLFDFSVTAKNIMSTSIYGLYPIPMSVHANLRWFFIN
nr:hypothetical protein [Candidatus Cloacimonadota bacterium]